jgi:hypothetical protein
MQSSIQCSKVCVMLHADYYDVWKLKMKGHFDFITGNLHCMTLFPLFVAEFHHCNFFSLCDMWVAAICVLNVIYTVTSEGTVHIFHISYFFILLFIAQFFNIYFGHPRPACDFRFRIINFVMVQK